MPLPKRYPNLHTLLPLSIYTRAKIGLKPRSPAGERPNQTAATLQTAPTPAQEL